eukprot:scaffold19053_cov99-Isochrysis_galbana.AAC.2
MSTILKAGGGGGEGAVRLGASSAGRCQWSRRANARLVVGGARQEHAGAAAWVLWEGQRGGGMGALGGAARRRHEYAPQAWVRLEQPAGEQEEQVRVGGALVALVDDDVRQARHRSTLRPAAAPPYTGPAPG